MIRSSININSKFVYQLSVLLVLTTLTGNIVASVNQLSWALETQLQNNTNFFLQQNDQLEINALSMSPRVSHRLANETSSLTTDINGHFYRYNEKELNNEDYGLSSRYQWNGQRNITQFSISRRDSQLKTTDIEFNEDVTSNENGRQELSSNFLWQYLTSEKGALVTQLQYLESDYENNDLADFSYLTTQVSYNIQSTDKLKLKNQIKLSRYSSQYELNTLVAPFYDPNWTRFTDIETQATTKGINLGFDWSIAERLTWSLGIGKSEVSNKQTANLPFGERQNFGTDIVSYQTQTYRSNGRNQNYNTSLSFSGIRNRFVVSVQNGVKQSANNTLVENKFIEINSRHQLSTHSSVSWRVKLDRQETIDEDLVTSGGEINRDYAIASLSWSKRLTQDWDFTSTLRYLTRQHEALQEIKPSATIFSLSFIYAPNN